MNFEQLAIILTSLIGSGGIIALLKARSEIRNANKSADIEGLKKTLETLQAAYKELQDRYQEQILDYKAHCSQIEIELKQIRAELEQRIAKQRETETQLQVMKAQLEIAQQRIAHLEKQLEERDSIIMMLQQENINLRKNPPGCREGLQTL